MNGLGTVEALSASDRTGLLQAVQKLEAYMVGPVATAIARRYAFWKSLQASAAQYGVNPADIIGAELGSANNIADRNAQSYATLLAGLSLGALKLAAWSPQAETPQPWQLGIVRADVQPSALGQWTLLPVAARVLGQVAIGAGAWILANAWTTSRELEAQAEKTRADTGAQITKTVSALAQQDPAQATVLATALAAAQKAATGATPGVLDQLAQSVQDITGTVREVGTGIHESSSALVLLGLVYLLSQRRKNPRGRAAAYVPALPRARAPRRLARSYAP